MYQITEQHVGEGERTIVYSAVLYNDWPEWVLGPCGDVGYVIATLAVYHDVKAVHLIHQKFPYAN